LEVVRGAAAGAGAGVGVGVVVGVETGAGLGAAGAGADLGGAAVAVDEPLPVGTVLLLPVLPVAVLPVAVLPVAGVPVVVLLPLPAAVSSVDVPLLVELELPDAHPLMPRMMEKVISAINAFEPFVIATCIPC
jgi:hypothetical protein